MWNLLVKKSGYCEVFRGGDSNTLSASLSLAISFPIQPCNWHDTTSRSRDFGIQIFCFEDLLHNSIKKIWPSSGLLISHVQLLQLLSDWDQQPIKLALFLSSTLRFSRTVSTRNATCLMFRVPLSLSRLSKPFPLAISVAFIPSFTLKVCLSRVLSKICPSKTLPTIDDKLLERPVLHLQFRPLMTGGRMSRELFHMPAPLQQVLAFLETSQANCMEVTAIRWHDHGRPKDS
jgi:hypothetical protein